MTASAPSLETDDGFDDSRAGLAMFLIFGGAVLIVSGAVAVIAFVTTWWMLVAAFTVHVVMTILVMGTIWHVLAGRSSAGSEQEPAEDARRDSRAPSAKQPLPAL